MVVQVAVVDVCNAVAVIRKSRIFTELLILAPSVSTYTPADDVDHYQPLHPLSSSTGSAALVGQMAPNESSQIIKKQSIGMVSLQ